MTRTSPTYIQGRVIIYLYLPLGRLTRENDEDRNLTIYYNYDSNGNIVTEYKYDSWGKVLSVTGSAANTIGTLNPIRYLGYFYDNDLGFYLLESRYYDPETGRFINADGVVDNRGVQTTNLYSYCGNNPINNKDENGHLLKEALIGAGVGALVGATINGIKAYKKCKA